MEEGGNIEPITLHRSSWGWCVLNQTFSTCPENSATYYDIYSVICVYFELVWQYIYL